MKSVSIYNKYDVITKLTTYATVEELGEAHNQSRHANDDEGFGHVG